eukprot:1154891-Pelagomonas_calceolata.AAC.2
MAHNPMSPNTQQGNGSGTSPNPQRSHTLRNGQRRKKTASTLTVTLHSQRTGALILKVLFSGPTSRCLEASSEVL